MKPPANIPFITTAQMIEVDRLMIEQYGIALIQMMENAGRNLADLARERFLDGDPRGRDVVVLAGSGGNGGGALVAARRLHSWGAAVRVVLSASANALTSIPARQLGILSRMEVSVSDAGSLDDRAQYDLVIDGLIGYNLRGAPRGTAADLIRWAGRQAAPVLALDVPSGLDATIGTTFEPAIRAAATMTLALPKAGLRGPDAGPYVGDLYLADIGVPPELYRAPSLGLDVGPLFASSETIRLDVGRGG